MSDGMTLFIDCAHCGGTISAPVIKITIGRVEAVEQFTNFVLCQHCRMKTRLDMKLEMATSKETK